MLEDLNIAVEIQELVEFINDDDFEVIIGEVAQLINEPNLAPMKVRPLIVKLQALSFNLSMQANYYKSIGKGGTNERYKKDAYYSARDALDRVVDAIKYLVK